MNSTPAIPSAMGHKSHNRHKTLMLIFALTALLLNILWGPTGWLSIDDWNRCSSGGDDCMPLTILTQIRLPRLLCAAMVGCALATAGVISQALFRNDLASPSVTGAESIGLLGASLAFVAVPAETSLWSMPAAALVAILVYSVILARFNRAWQSDSTQMLLLVGISIGAACAAITALILSIVSSDPMRATSLLNWLMGSLNSRSWSHVLWASPLLVLGLILARHAARHLDYLSFGREFSAGIGIEVARLEIQLMLTVSLLIGASLSIAGGVVFAGLIVPHITRSLLGPHHQRLLFWSAVNGISLLVCADLVAKSAFQNEIHTGTIVGLIGAPFFCFVLLTKSRAYRGTSGAE